MTPIEKDTFENFSFLITLNILLSTAGAYFVDENQIISETWQKLLTEWYLIPILFLIISFVIFQMDKNKFSQRDLFYINKLLLIAIILDGFVLINSAHPLLIHPIVGVLTLITAIAGSIVTPIFIFWIIFCEFTGLNKLFRKVENKLNAILKTIILIKSRILQNYAGFTPKAIF